MTDTLTPLLALSRNLGEPHHDYVILGEGNTSARIDADRFWVKASGVSLVGITGDGFVQVDTSKILAFLDEDLSDTAIKDRLTAAVIAGSGRPSVETALHALALTLGGARFVGHTHPTAVNAVLCSRQAEQAVSGRLFPDEIVVCGPAPLFIPYIDPGLPLARAVREGIERHIRQYGEPPRVILMQNHGLVALGQTAEAVEQITAMMVKTARILLGTYALGGPQFLSPEAVARIHTRPDEHYRRGRLQSNTGSTRGNDE
ncbi:MAG: class II aldolase/adducin family protein [Anaerolineaceae bacterium]|nr:class II aldolase/adducin family protein [Anaerolineaceae bacterium]